MTTWSTIAAIIIALAVRDALNLLVSEAVNWYYRYKSQKEFELLLDEWIDDLASTKPAKKTTTKKAAKAAVKRK